MVGRGRSRDERGLVLPTRLMVFSASLVALAGLAFIATQPDDGADTASPAAATGMNQQKPVPSGGSSTVPVTPTTTTQPEVRRAQFHVVVFNNSNVRGLAGRTGDRVKRAGWDLVGTDNWYGTVDATTVYYPSRMKAAATALAADLGITRVKPAIAPMRPDRLTVILTGDYAD